MPSIVDYAKSQNLDHIITNDLVHQLYYLLHVRESLLKDKEDLDRKIDRIIQELKESGVKLERLR